MASDTPTDPGVPPHTGVTGGVEGERNHAFTRLAVERLIVLPGVTSVAVTSMPPLTSDGARSTIHIPGYVEQPDEVMDVAMVTAGPDFFKTLGIPMHSGRELAWGDRDTLPRVVVNQSMAERYWGSRDPVGSFVRLGGEGGAPAEVIGVAADARFIALGESRCRKMVRALALVVIAASRRFNAEDGCNSPEHHPAPLPRWFRFETFAPVQ